MAEIVDFRTRAVHRAIDEPDLNTIEILEHFLELARAGVTQSVVVVTTDGHANPDCALNVDPEHARVLMSRLQMAIDRIAAVAAPALRTGPQFL